MTIDPIRSSRRTVLAASGSLAALGLAGCVGDDAGDVTEDDHDGERRDDERDDHGHVEVGAFELFDRESEESLADVHDDHWDGGPLSVPLEDATAVGARAENADGGEIDLGEAEEYQLGAGVADGAAENVGIESRGDHVELIGEEEGITEVVLRIRHGDHADWESPALEVEVGEAADADETGDGHHGDHDHDHDH
ncbi:hypothetical protein [Natronococcus jeotgali]|uniref:Aspartic acid-rich protein n=1 Tax=Natronococcus jeotgali DSM 18795 TaxID=1227498 RepID=L9WWG4_9EURY|nr:hypothetical protein [Natronococcus jeotgali]ELY53762.1 aspartic acid-rich protein [Natronococcus jeotgali DSM 18795]